MRSHNHLVRNILREREDNFCILELEILGNHVSICGAQGWVVSREQAIEMLKEPNHGHEPMLERDGKVYLLEGCGQIEAIFDFFPEVIPFRRRHLMPPVDSDKEWIQTICPNDYSFTEYPHPGYLDLPGWDECITE